MLNYLVHTISVYFEFWVKICGKIVILSLLQFTTIGITNCSILFPNKPLNLNSSPPGQNGRHFANGIFKPIVLNKKDTFFTSLSLKFVPEGPIDNNSTLVYIVAWRQIGDKPLSQPKLTRFTYAYMQHYWDIWGVTQLCLFLPKQYLMWLMVYTLNIRIIHDISPI